MKKEDDKLNILIIDDDPGLRKTLSDILRAKGYLPHAAGDGAEGLAHFRENPVNLALIDLKLPDMSGIEVLDRVKTASPSTQAIILTGSATLDSAIEATNKGAFSYLQKPYDIEQLMLHIRRAIEKQRAEEQITRYTGEIEGVNAALKALHEVSLVISKTIDTDKLFPEILKVVTEMEIFRVERKGAIFLMEGDCLRLVAHIGEVEAVQTICREVPAGKCHCGNAAATGEIVTSNNCAEDGRHTIRHEGVPPHGHVVIPLKSMNRVMGVLCLYTKPGVFMSQGMFNQLFSIGNQIGLAIENAKLYEEMKTVSLHDPLTGLGNRRLLDKHLDKIFDSARRYEKPFSLLMLDIDYFKKYNDTHGHQGGDRLLADLARLFIEEMRNADWVFRYGGEEFLILCPNTGMEGAVEAAERLRAAVEARGGVTVSIGVVAYLAQEQQESLIGRADAALYRAKQNGRNRVETDPPIQGTGRN
jgi:diguanylate cyclase (GGDEF)-like protein